MAKTVFLNPGHGGSDPGAVANGLKEKDFNLTTALACRDELKRHGVTVVMGRTKDVDMTSGQIISLCNASGADLTIDVHHNAGKGGIVEMQPREALNPEGTEHSAFCYGSLLY